MKKIIFTIAIATAVAGFMSSCQQSGNGDMAAKMNGMVDSLVKIKVKSLSDSLTMACNKNVMDSAMKLADKMEADKKKSASASAWKPAPKPADNQKGKSALDKMTNGTSAPAKKQSALDKLTNGKK